MRARRRSIKLPRPRGAYSGRVNTIDLLIGEGRQARSRVSQTFVTDSSQHAAGSDLDKSTHALSAKPAHTIGKTHSRTRLLSPLGGIAGTLAGERSPSHIRNHRNKRLAKVQAGGDFSELF